MRAVIAIANSAQAVQPLQLGDGADKPAVLAALTAAAHQHQHRVLALPATEQAADYAEAHRYADTTTDAAGRPRQPAVRALEPTDRQPGHRRRRRPAARRAAALAHRQRRRHQHQTAAAHQPDEDRDPAHTLTDVLTRQLPWAQHLGALDPTRQRPTAIEAATTHLAATGDDTSDAHRAEATELLARRDQLTARYHTLTQPRTHHTDLGHDRSHDTGLEL